MLSRFVFLGTCARTGLIIFHNQLGLINDRESLIGIDDMIALYATPSSYLGIIPLCPILPLEKTSKTSRKPFRSVL